MLKRTVSAAAGLLLCALALPMLMMGTGGGEPPAASAASGTPAPRPSPSVTDEPVPAPVSADGEVAFTLLHGGETREVTLAEYLPFALAGEMPAAFEPEALKAQAVAIRSYTLYHIENGSARHPEADICGDYSCCQAYRTEAELREKWGDDYSVYMARLRLAVEATDGEYLSYGGEPILAAFHSSSAGVTEDSGSVWSELPYLVSVSSPEGESDVPNYVSVHSFSAADFSAAIAARYPAAILGGGPESWLGEVTVTPGGRVESVVVGGVPVPGGAMRGMFSLRSAAFELKYTEGMFVFTVTGFGHGVGMSQYGANVMAENGADYAEILAHYYSGAELVGG